ncbi:MAG TPA: hypothetical protein IAC00_08795 [Candidatus Limivicinus faecipullorum]|nr:hypothetical protein [Candidatus Limivicinus faecipullorum]
MENQMKLPVDSQRLREFTVILQKYKTGKHSVERRTIAAENWWKLRNQAEERKTSEGLNGFQAVSGWLHNVIVSKHADAMEAYPEPSILPREAGDRQEASVLSKIIPVILEQNEFEKTYSDAMWQKLKTGTGVYKVYWDPEKLNGLGDIAIERVDLLNLFWEPGTEDIQNSPYFFHTRLENNRELEETYPQLKGQLKGTGFLASRFLYDDAVSTEGKSTVVDVYYKRKEQGRSVLHYCKYVGDTVLYSTENIKLLRLRSAQGEETEALPAGGGGLYEHGLYPFVFDSLFPIEGSPCGYGFIDLCQNSQTQIDMMQTAFIKNTMVGSVPRYFQRVDGAINEEEFLDLNNPIIHVSGNLGQDSLRTVDYRPLSGNYIDMRTSVINELRETSGNTETSVGLVSSGVTAASAIAALQEASGKGSRDATRASYRAYGKIISLCIELIRQFYELPRQFRITGNLGVEKFIDYSNRGLLPQSQSFQGIELGMRLPVFDIKVIPQKSSSYTRLSQNELALQFYQMGFFSPNQADQALACMSMMEFEGKDELMQRICLNGTMQRKLSMFQQYALAMTEKYEPERAAELMGSITGDAGIVQRSRTKLKESGTGENSRVAQARRKAQSVSQPGGR